MNPIVRTLKFQTLKAIAGEFGVRFEWVAKMKSVPYVCPAKWCNWIGFDWKEKVIYFRKTKNWKTQKEKRFLYIMIAHEMAHILCSKKPPEQYSQETHMLAWEIEVCMRAETYVSLKDILWTYNNYSIRRGSKLDDYKDSMTIQEIARLQRAAVKRGVLKKAGKRYDLLALR